MGPGQIDLGRQDQPPLKHLPARVLLFRDHLIGELKSWFADRR